MSRVHTVSSAERAATLPPANGARQMDLGALDAAPEALRGMLVRMIEQGSPHLILSGTDPQLPRGCCPARLVGAAHRLAEAGILDRWRRPTPIGACPVTVFACRGEILSGEGRPSFQANAPLRDLLLRRLQKGRKWAAARSVLRTALLTFVAFTIAIVFWDAHSAASRDAHAPSMTAGLPRNDLTLLVLFRGAVRCPSCEHMDAYAREGLARAFEADLREGRMAYREIDYERPAYRDLRNLLGLAATTLAVAEVRDGQAVRWSILAEAWELTEDREAFLKMVAREISNFREPPHE